MPPANGYGYEAGADGRMWAVAWEFGQEVMRVDIGAATEGQHFPDMGEHPYIKRAMQVLCAEMPNDDFWKTVIDPHQEVGVCDDPYAANWPPKASR